MSIPVHSNIEPMGNFYVIRSFNIDHEGVRLNEVINQVKSQIESIATDFYTKSESDAKYATKTELSNGLSGKVNIRSGYDLISDADKAQIQTNKSSIAINKSAISDLRSDLSTAETKIASKANQTEVDTIKVDVATKASQAEVNAIKSDVATKASTSTVSALQSDLAVQESRMDQLVGTVPAGSADEIADARVTADGKTEDNLGNAIRSQVSSLKETIDKNVSDLYKHLSTTMTRFKSRNVLKNSDFERGLVNSYQITDSDSYSYVYVDVEPNTQYTFSVANVANSYITFKNGTSWIYDSRINIMGSEGIKTKTFTTSSETTVLCVCVNNINKASAQIELGAVATAHEDYYDFYRPYDITELKKGNFDTMEGFINIKHSKNIINPANYHDNKGANWSTISDRTGYCFVDAPTKPNTTYTFSQQNTGNIRIRERLTTDWNWSSTKENTYPEKTVTITTSSNTDFLRIEIAMINKSTAQLEIGTVATAYTPYFEDYYYLNNNVVVEEARESVKLAEAVDNKVKSIDTNVSDLKRESVKLAEAVDNIDTNVSDLKSDIYSHLSTTMTRLKSRNVLKNSDFERGLVNSYQIIDSDDYSYVYVDVEPNTQYTFSVANVANSYITFKNGTSWIYDSRIDIMGSEKIKTKTFTTSSETTVLCVCVNNINKASAQIELGAVATAHEDYYDFYRPYDITELKKGNFDTMEGFINTRTSKNKINPANFHDDKGASWSTITDRPGYCFVDVPTKPNTTYTFSQQNTGNIRIRERLTTDWNWSSTKENTYPEKTVTITTSENTDFLRIEIGMNNKSTAQLEIGTVPTAYSPYFEDYYYLNNNVVVEEARESMKLAEALDSKVKSINYATEKYHAQEEAVIYKVEQAIEENSIVFVMITDVHGTDKLNGYQPTEGYQFNGNYGYYKFRECASVTRKLAENVGADFLINLGDTINSTSDEAYLATDSSVLEVNHVEIKKRFAEFTRNIQGRVPYLYAPAHHELYPYGHANALTKGEVYGIANRYTKYFDYKVNDGDVRTRGYYYIDIPNKDLRVIVLDSCCWSSNNYSETECDWLRDVALNTDNKVIVFSHMGTTAQTTTLAPDNGALVQSILNDSGKVIAFFHGHTHCDNLILPSESGVNFPIVSLEKAWPTTNKTIASGTGIIGNPKSWDRAYNSYLEYCVDIVVLNTKTGSFKTFRFGAGEDRQYNP